MTPEEARERFPPIWVLYDHPLDHPETFVVRKWWGVVPEAEAGFFETLEQARVAIREDGAEVCLHRFAGDDPFITECWI